MAAGKENDMRHIRTLSSNRPAPAQFESVLQLVGLFNAILALYTNISQVFGLPVPQKEE
jgi:hypothetical protein